MLSLQASSSMEQAGCFAAFINCWGRSPGWKKKKKEKCKKIPLITLQRNFHTCKVGINISHVITWVRSGNPASSYAFSLPLQSIYRLTVETSGSLGVTLGDILTELTIRIKKKKNKNHCSSFMPLTKFKGSSGISGRRQKNPQTNKIKTTDTQAECL